MDFRKFVLYNIIGAVVWVCGLMSLGFALGKNQWVKDHLEYIVIALILVTTLPVIIKMVSSKVHHKKTTPDQ